MSLFKLDSKIYGAWLVEREDYSAVNCHTHVLAAPNHAYQLMEAEESDNNSNSKATKRLIKKIFSLKS